MPQTISVPKSELTDQAPPATGAGAPVSARTVISVPKSELQDAPTSSPRAPSPAPAPAQKTYVPPPPPQYPGLPKTYAEGAERIQRQEWEDRQRRTQGENLNIQTGELSLDQARVKSKQLKELDAAYDDYVKDPKPEKLPNIRLLESIYSGRFEPRPAAPKYPTGAAYGDMSRALGYIKPWDELTPEENQKVAKVAADRTIQDIDSVLNRRKVLDQRANQLLRESPALKMQYNAEMKSLSTQVSNVKSQIYQLSGTNGMDIIKDADERRAKIDELVQQAADLASAMATLPQTIAERGGISIDTSLPSLGGDQQSTKDIEDLVK